MYVNIQFVLISAEELFVETLDRVVVAAFNSSSSSHLSLSATHSCTL